MNKFLSLVLTIALFGASNTASAQCPNNLNGGDCTNTLSTSIPFLRINPDARSGGMGDVGLATTPDAASIYYNNAKLPFAEDRSGLALTYTPWLIALVPDMFITQLAAYHQLNELQALSGSFRYFNMGEIQFTDENGIETIKFNPHEFVFDLGYARKLSERISLGLTLKYAYSNLAKRQVTNSGELTAATAMAADLSFYYETPVSGGVYNNNFALGAAITNIGNKVSYTGNDFDLFSGTKDFIPTNLGIGAAYTINLNENHSLMFTGDLNKLLVPTPDTLIAAGNPAVFDHREKSVFEGMVGSFSDAPGGFGEELQEIMLSLGVEYWFKEFFAIRTGFFYENPIKGNREYLTFGLSGKHKVVGVNLSYLLPTSIENNINPLKHTMRFSLFVDLDQSNEK